MVCCCFSYLYPSFLPLIAERVFSCQEPVTLCTSWWRRRSLRRNDTSFTAVYLRPMITLRYMSPAGIMSSCSWDQYLFLVLSLMTWGTIIKSFSWPTPAGGSVSSLCVKYSKYTTVYRVNVLNVWKTLMTFNTFKWGYSRTLNSSEVCLFLEPNVSNYSLVN